MILIALLSNVVFKTTTVAALGHRALFFRVALANGLVLLTGLLVMRFWSS